VSPLQGEKPMRRLFFGLLAALLLMPVSILSVLAAQDATPASGLADADVPQLDVTLTATGYEGIPDQVEAGRYLVSLTLEEGASEFGGGVSFVQPPADISAEDFLVAYMTPSDESGVGEAAATPIEGGVATPAEGEGEMGGLPSFLFEATYAGGTYSFAGGVTEVVLDLTPGEWIAWTDDFEAPQEPVFFEVTGEMPAELTEPESSATITMGEYVIEVTEGELTSGSQVIRIDNIGAQPHFLAWFGLPEGTTEEQIQTVLDEEMQAEMTGTPAAFSDLNPDEDFMPVVFTATQSSNTSIWITVDLEAGTHGLACFFPDLSDGMPHAYHGMYTVIEVAE
ncbi:MAG TPA: hypothetical protein VGR29_01810, partial [Thermomicrobiales bacterium]|nr:hypothetical protein [Thermomicrobiales bacterium]